MRVVTERAIMAGIIAHDVTTSEEVVGGLLPIRMLC